MKRVRYRNIRDSHGNVVGKVLNIKNMELFKEYIQIAKADFDIGMDVDCFCEDETEVIREEIESLKRAIICLEQDRPDFTTRVNQYQNDIRKLESLLKKYK